MKMRRAVIWLVLLVVTAYCFPGSPLGRTEVSAVFDSTPAYPGYPWTRDGQQVSPFEVNTIAGPNHCGWQSATFLHIGWPPGTKAITGDHSHQYIRDPRGVTPTRLRQQLDLHATLPRDAHATGYVYSGIAVYVSPSDENDAIYLVGSRSVERWPRSNPQALCM